MTEEQEQPIPGYRILRQLGEGGFAKVYLAQHEMFGEAVALKIMFPKLANEVANCERFIREARTLAKLRNHESIVTVHDIAKTGKFYYMAMEYLGDKTLRQVLTDNQLKQPIIDIIRPLASALAYAHNLGIVHRDIKPSNIIFNNAGQPVLTDFGIAKRRDSSEHTLTHSSVVVGTMQYMAPEQFFGADLDARSDLYALGVVLFELLTNRRLHQAEEQIEENDFGKLLTQRMSSDAPALPKNQAHWQPIITRLLARNPEDRYDDAEQLLEHLNELFPQHHSPPLTEQKKPFIKWASIGSATLGLCISAYILYNLKSTEDENVCVLPYKSAQLSTEENATVNRLLSMAISHETVGRVVMPPGANAREAYQVVLGYDPSNLCAQTSLERIDNSQ